MNHDDSSHLPVTPDLITAYALGELDGEQARAVEAHLQAHPEAAAEVAQLKVVTSELTAGLDREVAEQVAVALPLPLQAAAAAPVSHAADASVAGKSGFGWSKLVAAAVVIAAATTAVVMVMPGNDDREIANLPTRDRLSATPDGRNVEGGLPAPTVAKPIASTEATPPVSRQPADPVPMLDAAATVRQLERLATETNPDALSALKAGDDFGGGAAGNGVARAFNEPSLAPSIALDPAGVLEKANGASALMSLRDRVEPGNGIALPPGQRFGDAAINPEAELDTERYAAVVDNAFQPARETPVSTFGVDVDTASLANTRRLLTAGTLPPPGAVRIEDFVNYFQYDYVAPAAEPELAPEPVADAEDGIDFDAPMGEPLRDGAAGAMSRFNGGGKAFSGRTKDNGRRSTQRDDEPDAQSPDDAEQSDQPKQAKPNFTATAKPFVTDVMVTNSPWQPANRLVRIGLQGKTPPAATRPASNLVFLVDVSGSMNQDAKLPLVKTSLRTLVGQLDERDTVAIVTYASGSSIALPPTNAQQAETILNAIDSLGAGGGTNGAAGINDAYQLARQNFVEGGINRVILATDGDFNVGVTNESELVELAKQQAESGVYLSVLGFGTGNYNDQQMETISNYGDGNYAYIDTAKEADRVLNRELLGTLWTVAKDVKVQVEFNPQRVAAYRLLGYENRIMDRQDFNDDTKDGGDIGAGHQVTALYEVVPTGAGESTLEAAVPASPDALRYQRTVLEDAHENELMTVKFRWKSPDAKKEQGTSQAMEIHAEDRPVPFEEAGEDVQLAASAAGLGMMLRDSPHKGNLTWQQLSELVPDTEQAEELRQLIDQAAKLAEPD